jgi:hypothetical protein
LWTRPLRPLTPETSRGFEVIDFARDILHVKLRRWQEWLLIHALEILPDGRYRFRRVTVLVARQNGKTMLMSVLAAWWIFVDACRHPELVPPVKFKVVGVAQNLDIAAEVWTQVKQWCNPEPETAEEAELIVPALQAATASVRDANGERGIFARSRAHYEMRAAKNARGKPAARAIMDEVRELKTWEAFNAVSQITKSFWSNQTWLISNAGDVSAIVLKKQRDVGLALIKSWREYVDAGLQAAEEWANSNDTSLGHFEWSAPEKCSLDDVDGILQANPSIGSPGCDITVASCLSDAASMDEAGYRTEVLCQWVTAKVEPYIAPARWRAGGIPADAVSVRRGERTVWGVDTGADRAWTWISAATRLDGGRPFVMVRTRRAGMLWVVDYLVDLAERSGSSEVALQTKGAPAMEFAEPLEKAGLTVIPVDGSHIGLATGRFKDRVLDGLLAHPVQPDIDLAIQGGVVKRYAENLAWDRYGSQPVDIAGLVAETVALYGLETVTPPVHEPVGPPPQAEIVTTIEGPELVNLAEAQF